MAQENWKPIPGYGGRYEASDMGRVRSLPFMQRYLLRDGQEAYRRTAERILSAHPQNSGYLVVHLYLDGMRRALTLHRLIAQIFVANPEQLPEVNHKDGVKTNCCAVNLEWVSRTDNKLHAVIAGLNSQAISVVAPSGKAYPSVAQAARGERVGHRTAAKWNRA